MAATFLVTGIASLLTGRLTERIGIVKSVVPAIYLVAYDRVFRGYEPPRESARSHAELAVARGSDVRTERDSENRAL